MARSARHAAPVPSVEIPVDDMVETKMPVVNRRNREELTAAT